MIRFKHIAALASSAAFSFSLTVLAQPPIVDASIPVSQTDPLAGILVFNLEDYPIGPGGEPVLVGIYRLPGIERRIGDRNVEAIERS